jgi:hypothetical protein
MASIQIVCGRIGELKEQGAGRAAPAVAVRPSDADPAEPVELRMRTFPIANSEWVF